MQSKTGETASDIRLVADQSWTRHDPPLADPNRLDPALRAAIALIESDRPDWDLLYRRTGIRWESDPLVRQQFPLLLEVNPPHGTSSIERARAFLETLDLKPDAGYLKGPPPWHLYYGLPVRADDPGRIFEADKKEGGPDTVRKLLIGALNQPNDLFVRIELPGAAQALNEDALADMEAADPVVGDPGYKSPVDGSGVVIGIIDDGCAFAHPNFVRWNCVGDEPKTRILSLWDQGRPPGGAWVAASSFESAGSELTNAVIDPVLRAHANLQTGLVDEEAVYSELGHELPDLASHGTHVMDIAAGSGRAPMSTRGVAPNADIVFVQLPRPAIATGGTALDAAIVAGVQYIFDRAADRAVVINISFGGYAGPHDGTSFVESTIDTLLADPQKPNRSVVVAAGNGFEADCHACGTLPDGSGASVRKLHWMIKPEDPTGNMLEVWYDADAALEVDVAPPGGTALGGVTLQSPPFNLVANVRGNDVLLGSIDHQHKASKSGLNRIRILVNPTGTPERLDPGWPPAESPPTALAPSGTWEVQLKLAPGSKPATYHAWIERDVSGRPGGARRRQSHFAPVDAEVRGTLASYATGNLSIAVGAYNTATQQVARYSACGPTRDGRPKPEVVAPAEEDAAGRGVLCASSRSAMPSRMNGTSAAAPQVTGLVALLLEAAHKAGKSLTAAKIRDLVRDGAADAYALRAKLLPNAHVAADDRRRVKQEAVLGDLVGDGRPNWPKSRDRLDSLP
jgi:subtilisin family serine protease